MKTEGNLLFFVKLEKCNQGTCILKANLRPLDHKKQRELAIFGEITVAKFKKGTLHFKKKTRCR